jgi:hypothetical protein
MKIRDIILLRDKYKRDDTYPCCKNEKLLNDDEYKEEKRVEKVKGGKRYKRRN